MPAIDRMEHVRDRLTKDLADIHSQHELDVGRKKKEILAIEMALKILRGMPAVGSEALSATQP